MRINLTTFFSYVRKAPFGGRLTQAQMDGMNAILAEWVARNLLDGRWLAYMLATAFHETGGRMQPVRETFANSDAAAIKALERAWRAGKLKWVTTPYWRDGWFGRGLVQITHEANYRKFGISKSDALDLDVSVRVLFDGMINGMFTGHKLSGYFNQGTNDPVGARRIVNGTDKAKLIAGYYKSFLDALEAARDEDAPPEVKPSDAKPDDVPVTESKSLWSIILTIFPGLGSLVFLEKITNPYAFGSFALIFIGVCVAAWLYFTGRITINRSKAL